jgi:hypothetical protein
MKAMRIALIPGHVCLCVKQYEQYLIFKYFIFSFDTIVLKTFQEFRFVFFLSVTNPYNITFFTRPNEIS